MARADKVAVVDGIADEFRSSSGAVLTKYRGLSVAQLMELRRALGELMQQFSDLAGQMPPGLGDADKAMEELEELVKAGFNED